MTTPGDPKGTKYDPANDPPPHEWTPDQLKPGDLERGLHMLKDAANRGDPWAAAILFELARPGREALKKALDDVR